MDRQNFTYWLQRVYAAFGKTPNAATMSAVFRRVDGLPDGFFEYAAERLEDREALPVNLGRELRRVLWPEYLEKNPGLRAREQRQGCRECAGSGMPGILWAYGPDGHRYACPCVCNNNPGLAHLRHWTRREIEAAGLTLRDPLAPVDAPARRRPLPVGGQPDAQARQRLRHVPDVERVDYGAAAGEVW